MGISRLRAKGLPLFARYVMKTHAALFYTGQRVFGTWSKALRSAGIPKIQMQGKGGLSILRAHRDIRESHPKKEISRALKLRRSITLEPCKKRLRGPRRIYESLKVGVYQRF